MKEGNANRDRQRLRLSAKSPPGGGRYSISVERAMSIDQRPDVGAAENQTAAEHAPAPITDAPRFAHIGAYEVEGIFDQDEIAVVYRAADHENQRIVAVKVLRQAAAGDPASRENFVRAGAAAAKSRTDYTAAVCDTGEHEGTPFVVMQLGSGGTLAERIDRGVVIEPVEVVHLGLVIATALVSAHGKGIVHREVRPRNVLWDATCWRYRLVDFGLVTKLESANPAGLALPVSKAEYLSPEQVRGDVVGARSDLFSLGCVLYAALIGQSPFHSATSADCLQRVLEFIPPDVRTLCEKCPVGLAALIARLLAKDPDERFASAEHVALELRRLEGKSGAPKRRQATVELDHGTLGSPLLRIAGVAALGLLACAVLALAIRFTSPPSATPSQEDAPHPNDHGQQIAPSAGAGRFTVVGDGAAHTSLAAAVEAAPAGGIVEIHGSEHLRMSPIAIHGKPLSIRAARGDRPVLVVSDESTVRAPAIYTDSSFSLAGIQLQRSAADDADESAILQHAAVMSTGGELHLEHCEIDVGKNLACVVAAGASADVRNCRLTAKQGVCIGWRPSNHSADKLVCDNSICAGHCDVLVALDSQSATADADPGSAASLDFEHTTCRGEQGVQLMLHAGPRMPLDVHASQTVFGVGNLLVMHWLDQAPNLSGVTNLAGVRRIIGAGLNWHDRENSFGAQMQFIAWQAPHRPIAAVEAAPRDVAAWDRFWSQRDSGSQMSQAGSQLSASIGADERFVGPGAADPQPAATGSKQR
jgi:hypothetical protein